ncbi:MAG: DUF898 domain-containing protein [Planctomycetes bacterium]|nr:DUF898 domain-containing protein [Planctomycetota bacterium]
MDNAPSAPALVVEPRTERLRFTATGGEYFRIWIVNLLLTIVTLGIYSAWAKVRKQRYFHGHTHLAGSTFDYHARPIAILKGRVIAAILFGLYLLATESSPIFLLVVVGMYLLIAPWIVLQALRFRARMSSWRGLRFGFGGTLGESYVVFALLTLLVPLTLGALLPYWWYRRQRFVLGYLRFGATQCSFRARVGSYYRVFGVLLAIVIGLSVIAGVLILMVSLAATLSGMRVPEDGEGAPWVITVGAYVVALLFGSVVNGCLRAMLGNVAIDGLRLGSHRILARFDAAKLVGIQLTNTLLVLVTLGLYTPWAQIRLQKYLVERIRLEVDGDLDSFVTAQSESLSATGGEMADVFDIDLGF